MPFLVVVIGIVVILAGTRGSVVALTNLFAQDSTQAPSLFIGLVGIVVVGSIGFYKPLEPLSRGLLALLVLAAVIHEVQGGLFDRIGVQWEERNAVRPGRSTQPQAYTQPFLAPLKGIGDAAGRAATDTINGIRDRLTGGH